MPRLIPLRRNHPLNPLLTRLCWQWLALGVLLSVAIPSARGYSTAIGWLWYWLIAAPLLAQCTLHRHTVRLWLRQRLSRRAVIPVAARKPLQARRIAVAAREHNGLKAA